MHGTAIIAIIKGGLGNQLFIYAAARALALRTGRELYLDRVRGYTADSYERSYRLDRFPIQARNLPETWRIAPDLRHLRHKVIRAFNKALPQRWRSYIAERAGTKPADLLHFHSRRRRVTLLGYWQNQAYFVDHAQRIRAELTPPVPADPVLRERGAVLAGCDSVFLHVRRKRYSILLDEAYYQRAIECARREIVNPVFVLFGDDLDWARASLDFGSSRVECQAYDQADELTDLWLMARCRHAIIANSSFSWWGAWLGGPASATRKIWAPVPGGMPLVNAPDWTGIPASPEAVGGN